MAVEVIEKKKGGLTCGDCGASVPTGASECPECGSSAIKKSLVVVRKSVADTEEELEQATQDSADVEEDDEIEDELDEDVDEDEDLEDDGDEDDEEDEEEDEEEEDVPVEKNFVGLEALSIGTAFAEDIAKAFAGTPSRKKYESVMTEFNNVADAAAEKWFAGGTVTKSTSTKALVDSINDRVSDITKEETVPKTAKVARPKGLDLDTLDDETRDYIEALEGGEVEKRVKYENLPREVRKSLQDAEDLIEKNAQSEWLEKAKRFSHLGEPTEVAKTLRSLSEADPEAYANLEKVLGTAEERVSTSDIFKRFGSAGGATKDQKREEEISKLMGDEKITREQAEVRLMDGSSYHPTNA